MDKLTVATSTRARPAKGGLSHLDANLRRLRAVFHFMEVGMGISLNKLNEMDMRCPIMNGIECMGDKCMLWLWDFDGRERTEYTSANVALGGEWVKDGDPYDDEECGFEQRWVHPPTGYCGLVKE